MTTIKETAKALFIEKDGVQVWIPKSWVKKDGALSVKALEKIEDEKQRKDFIEETKTWTLQKSINAEDFYVIKETEKAICVNCFDEDGDFNIWIPKSMKDEYWFVNKKMEEHGRYLILR